MKYFNANIRLFVSKLIKTLWYYTAIDGTRRYVIPEEDETGYVYNICSMSISLFHGCYIEFIPTMGHRKEIFRMVSEEYKSRILISMNIKTLSIARDIYITYMPKNTRIFIYDIKKSARCDITDSLAEIPPIKTVTSIKYIPKGDRVVMYCDLIE